MYSQGISRLGVNSQLTCSVCSDPEVGKEADSFREEYLSRKESFL